MNKALWKYNLQFTFFCINEKKKLHNYNTTIQSHPCADPESFPRIGEGPEWGGVRIPPTPPPRFAHDVEHAN